MDTKQIGPFLGINNRLPDFALATDKGYWLREAENVEIDNAGRVRRRAAATLVHAMSNAHSLYLTSTTVGYLVRGGTLYAITLPAYTETAFKVLTNDNPLSWCAVNNDLYYSNGTDFGRITSGIWFPHGLPTPNEPAVSSVGGGLFAGKYQVAVAYYNAVTGEEGGVSASTNYELASGGLRVTLPAATAGATHVNVYVSAVNGGVPLLAATVTAGAATADVVGDAAGREANQRYEEPLPAGTHLFYYNGRLCAVDGKTVYLGSPHRHGYYLPVEGRIDMPEDVTLAAPAQLGVYIAYGSVTQFYSGPDLGAVELVLDVLPYGAVPGTFFRMPNKPSEPSTPIVGWFGEKGIVLGDTQGQVTEVMADAVDQVPPASGVSFVVQSNGYRRVVSCGWCVNLESGAATQYVSYPVTSEARGYGLTTGGLYNLSGTGAVEAHVGLGKQNFGTENLTRLPACYLGVTSDTPMELRVTTPDDEDYRYEARSSAAERRVQRVDPGKGLRANWYDLSLYNTEGSDFTLASVSFAPVASGRKI